MKISKSYVLPELPAAHPLIFDPEVCTGCNKCVNICQVDVLLPNPKKGRPPLVAYPGECWYGGCCVEVCPKDGAIKLRHPLFNRPYWATREEIEKL